MGVIRWLFDHFYGCTVSDSAVADAAKHGNLELLQFFKKFGTPADDAEGGDIRLGAGTYPLNQGIRHFVKWGRRDMAYAARYNHPEIVWWLHHNVPVYRWAMVDVVAAAVKNKDMMMVAWVHQNYRVDPESVSNAMQEAVSGGRLDILDWLYDNGYAATTYPLVDDAVVGGNRDVLDWVIDRNLVKPGQVIAVAAKGGNLELATYLYDHYWQKRPHQHYLLVHTRLAHLPTKDSDWISEETMQSAIANGHLEVVQWLYETFADEPEIDLFRGCTQRAFEWTAPEDIYKWLQDPYSDLEPQNDFYVVLLIG
ncbi:hypothetical protein PHYPSEUDO_006271 [Phytophthora pseudosyringae]|uniref:Uncharacterized protein n=1 Tax=Phytophthora pseudosyringae TaxID=221518 RepID=A0A8T1VIY6_9STRA|nr:hypothetical protein PHYPSEUDO_006271 [Phytophthora pseudosyringae]